MAEAIRRFGDGRWEWNDGVKWRGVAAFPNQRRLIWSSWLETGEGAQYEDGVAQMYEAYLSGEPAPFSVPMPVADELHVFLGGAKRQTGESAKTSPKPLWERLTKR